jgi:ribA/ribD-fused uncharacterized protein
MTHSYLRHGSLINYPAGTSSVSSQKKKPKPMKAVHNLVSLPSSLTSRFSSSTKVSGESIKFYNRGEPYYEFTNFYPAAVIIDEQRWPSTEHYFQAQKFVGTPYLDIVRGLPSAREAFQLSRNPMVSQWRRSDWDAVKDDIMLKALRCKFAQHTDLMNLLWETGEKEIIEHTTNDSYWADGGGPGRGLNKLGKLLMQVRDDIVAMRGTYKPPKKTKSSKGVSKGGKLKRSSSFSDLSTAGHAPKDSNFSFEQESTVAPKKPALRRSNSFSRLSLASNDTSRSSTMPIARHPRDTSGIKNVLFSPKTTTSFYPHSSSSRQTTLNDFMPTLSKSGTSSRRHSAKGPATPPSYSSAVKSSYLPGRHSSSRPGEPRLNPITHQPLPY